MPGIGRVSRPSLLARAALLLVALATVGCTDVESGRPTIGPERHVEVAGVVASVSTGAEGSRGFLDYSFDDGRTYRVYSGAAGGAAVGELLLAGKQPWPWVDSAQLYDPAAGCYGYPQNGYERATTIQLDSGLVLDKAPNYSRPGKSERLFGLVLCLDKQARVFYVYG